MVGFAAQGINVVCKQRLFSSQFECSLEHLGFAVNVVFNT
jgi:hypothetical protein